MERDPGMRKKNEWWEGEKAQGVITLAAWTRK